MENLNELARSLEKYWPQVAAAVAAVGTFLYGLQKNIEIFDWFHARSVEKLKNIESHSESDELKNLLKRLKDEEAFRAATNINAEGRLKEMISFIECSRGQLDMLSIRSAQSFFKHDSPEVDIRVFSRWDPVWAWGSAFLGFLIYSGSSWLFVEIAFFVSRQFSKKAMTIPESISLMVGSLVCLVFAWVVATLLMKPHVSYKAATRVKAYLANEPKLCLNVPT